MSIDVTKLTAVILAGGKGTRLRLLTQQMPKPAVPFASKLRLIDFPLFNAVNSKISQILILTQYGHYPIQKHVDQLGLTNPVHGKYVNVLPPQYMNGHGDYLHTANAVHQNAHTLREMEGVEDVLILSGDHIYKQDYRIMYTKHVDTEADFTIAGFWVSPEEASHFGIMEVDNTGNIVNFIEKPQNPKPGKNGKCFASMGIYLAKKDFLLSELEIDHENLNSEHDFGGDVIPAMIYGKKAKVITFDYHSHIIDGEDKYYWKDVGRLGQLLEANMDLVNPTPELNLYNHKWPINSRADNMPGAKWVQLRDTEALRPDWVQKPLGYITAGGCIFDWPSNLDKAVIHRNVRIGRFSELTCSVIYDRVRIGGNVKIKRAIVMEGATIHDGAEIGYDYDKDHQRGIYVDADEGVVIVPEGVEIFPYEEETDKA